MKPDTLKAFKANVREFSKLYEELVTLWNGELKHGNNAIFPVTIIVKMIVHNIGHDGSNCVNYSHEEELKKCGRTLKCWERLTNMKADVI